MARAGAGSHVPVDPAVKRSVEAAPTPEPSSAGEAADGPGSITAGVESRAPTLSRRTILTLQRTAGNATVAAYLSDSRGTGSRASGAQPAAPRRTDGPVDQQLRAAVEQRHVAEDACAGTPTTSGDQVAGRSAVAPGAATATATAGERSGPASSRRRPGALALLARSPWDKLKNVAGDVVDGAKNLVGKGKDFVLQKILGPLRDLASKVGRAVPDLMSRFGKAFRNANPDFIDILLPADLMLRTVTTVRRDLYADAIAQEQRQRRAAAAAGNPRQTAETAPGPLERIDGVARSIEDLGLEGSAALHGVIEGAVLGDFNENPTIWNTIGQVAIGFVPYAGQAADVRDIVANIKKLHENGWKRPGDWFDLVLSGIGIIPGVGDAVKAVGRGAKGAIKKGVKWIAKSGRGLWAKFGRQIPALRNGLKRFGSTLRHGLSSAARKIVGKAQSFGRGLVKRATGIAKRAGSFAKKVSERVSSMAKGIAGAARGAASKARGLIGKIAGALSGPVRSLFDRITGVVSRGMKAAKDGLSKAGAFVRNAKRKVKDVIDKARKRITDLARGVRQRANKLRNAAARWIKKKATWVASKVKSVRKAGLKGVAKWLRNAAKSVKKKVVDLAKRGYAKARDRVLRWLKKLRTTKPSGPADPNAVPDGTRTRIRPKDDAEVKRSLQLENETADILAKAGYKTNQNPKDLSAADKIDVTKNPDFRIEGKIFDCFAPRPGAPVRNIFSVVENKVAKRQTKRVIVNLTDWDGDLAALRKQFKKWDVTELEEVLVVTKSKSIERIYP